MPGDEQAIREFFETWLRATRTRDLDQLLPLMSEDVVFLTVGQPPMRGRDAFAAAFQAGSRQGRIEPVLRNEEIQIAGDVAYCRSYLEVTVTPEPEGPSKRMTGYILSVLRKQPDGRWVLVRDANLLIPEGS